MSLVSRSAPRPALVVLLLLVAVSLMLGQTGALAAGPATRPVTDSIVEPGTDPDGEVEALLGRAVEVSRDLRYEGRVTVASFAEDGPSLAALEVSRGPGGLKVARGGEQLGRAEGEGFLRSSSRLLRVGGVERVPAQLDRLRAKYELRIDGTVELDTGPATALVLVDRYGGEVREKLFCDQTTGLIVRRETFDDAGDPVRVVAFTQLRTGDHEVVVPSSDGRDVEERHGQLEEVARLRRSGFVVLESLPRTYELLAAVEVPDASVPTAHLVYGDGLYTVSVFQQLGRMDRRVVEGATPLETEQGGTLWRWPGSEPRRVVWTGGGITFTALADAPTDELVHALADLPADPDPGPLDRLARGLVRLGGGLMPG